MRIFITGSSTGLGLAAAQYLGTLEHDVVVHGRTPQSAQDALKKTPNAQQCVHGDLASLHQVFSLAEQVNKLGQFDAIIHNAAIGVGDASRIVTENDLPRTFVINVLSPYVLTALIARPERLIYISSSMQLGIDGRDALADPLWEKRPWSGSVAYSESKLMISMFAFAIADCWQPVFSNTVDPGWVPTRMGGKNATDDIHQGHLTQAWLATSNDPEARVTKQHFYHMQPRKTNPDALRPDLQDLLLTKCALLSGVSLPA